MSFFAHHPKFGKKERKNLDVDSRQSLTEPSAYSARFVAMNLPK